MRRLHLGIGQSGLALCGQVLISPGTSYIDAVYEHTSTPSAFYKSRISWDASIGWSLRLKEGTVYSFRGGDGATVARQAGLLRVRDRYGNTVSVIRDANSNLTRLQSPYGRYIDFTYDATNRVTQATDNIGRTVNYTYDASGRLWKITNPMGGVTEYGYDSSHRMVTIKNPRGIVYVTNEYNANGRVGRQTHADGGVYQFGYTIDGNGKVTQADVTDPRSNHRLATFNSIGYVLSDTHSCCSGSIVFERQSGTNIVTSITDQLQHRTEFTVDSMGNIASMTRQPGTLEAITTSSSYESSFNRLASTTDPLGHSFTLLHDSNGNTTMTTDPLGSQYTATYNSAGQATSLTNPLNHTSQFTYDGGDRVSATNPLGNAITAFTDAAGRGLAFTDPLGRVVRCEYDALSRLSRIIDPRQGGTQYAYDANGNLLNVTDARGNVTTYAYDDMDRLITRTDQLLHAEGFQYDLNGNLTQVTDRKGQVTTYAYDAMNRLTQVQYGDQSTTSYGYDAAGRLTQAADSVSGTITYGYDNLDRITSESTPQGTVAYAYDAANRTTGMTIPGQSTINYAYDSADRLTQITQGAATVTIAYDAVGRRTALTLPNGIVTQYGYDAASRLTGLIYTKGAATLGNLTYDYDGAAVRAAIGGSFARTALPQALSATNNNSANQQTTFGSQSLIYDNNGNLTSDGINTYVWDARDQLVSTSGPGFAASFQYDAFGRRVAKTFNGTTTNFLYDGDDAVQEQVGGVPTANMLVGGLDEVLTRTDSSGTWSLIADALGSTIGLTDASGALQTQYTYEPFGRTTSSGSSNLNASQFTARENDSTGVYYYRSRYYSPSLQRFISEDPLGFGAGVNFYSYVLNSPANLVDPFGLKPQAARSRRCTDNELLRCKDYCDKQGKSVQACLVREVRKITRLGKEPRWVDSDGWLGPAPLGCYCNEGQRPPVPICDRFRQPTNEEIRLREKSHRDLARFWEWVLVGDYALFVVGTAGAGALSGAGAGAGAGRLAPILATP
jgi:RHS repeat-associated protein